MRTRSCKAPIDAGVSIAIDGRVIATGLTEPIPEGSEVYLMQRLKGRLGSQATKARARPCGRLRR